MSTPYYSVPLFAAILTLSLPVGPSAQSSSRPPSGIFLQGTDGKMTQIPSTTSTDIEQHGVGKSMLTQGFVKPSVTVRHSNVTADVAITDPQPTFLFRFQDQGRVQMDMASMMENMSAGMPLAGKNPKEYALARLTVEGDSRMASSKGMKTFKFEVQPKAPREFEVHVSEPLEPGEYAFYQTASGAPAQIWAFSLKK